MNWKLIISILPTGEVVVVLDCGSNSHTNIEKDDKGNTKKNKPNVGEDDDRTNKIEIRINKENHSIVNRCVEYNNEGMPRESTIDGSNELGNRLLNTIKPGDNYEMINYDNDESGAGNLPREEKATARRMRSMRDDELPRSTYRKVSSGENISSSYTPKREIEHENENKYLIGKDMTNGETSDENYDIFNTKLPKKDNDYNNYNYNKSIYNEENGNESRKDGDSFGKRNDSQIFIEREKENANDDRNEIKISNTSTSHFYKGSVIDDNMITENPLSEINDDEKQSSMKSLGLGNSEEKKSSVEPSRTRPPNEKEDNIRQTSMITSKDKEENVYSVRLTSSDEKEKNKQACMGVDEIVHPTNKRENMENINKNETRYDLQDKTYETSTSGRETIKDAKDEIETSENEKDDNVHV